MWFPMQKCCTPLKLIIGDTNLKFYMGQPEMEDLERGCDPELDYKSTQIDLSAVKPWGTLVLLKQINGYILPLAPQFLLLASDALCIQAPPLPSHLTFSISIPCFSITLMTLCSWSWECRKQQRKTSKPKYLLILGSYVRIKLAVHRSNLQPPFFHQHWHR